MRVCLPSGEVGVEIYDSAAVDRDGAKHGAGLRTKQLPGDDVRVMLETRDDDLVARQQARPAVGLRDEVDRLGRAADKNDFGRGRGVDEAPHLLARALVEGRRLLGERMHAAVHVGVVGARVVGDRVDDGRGLLRRGGVVEVGERMAVDAPREHGKSPRMRARSRGGRLPGRRPSAGPADQVAVRQAAGDQRSAASRRAANGRRGQVAAERNVRSARAVAGSMARDSR
jgi:hypothetical protein